MKIAIVGPVYPYRAGIAYCTTRLAEELQADVVSFKRQYPKRFYPGGDDVDPTLPRTEADFLLDVLNPLTWFRAGRRLRAYDAVIFVWWIWVWALPYRVIMALLPRRTRVILQCHNVGDKEPARWKRMLTNVVLRRGDVLVVHAKSEADEVWRRLSSLRSGGQAGKPAPHLVTTFLPVHELGGAVPTREEARVKLGIGAGNVALFFGHVRPFKGLDVALAAWRKLDVDALLLVAGEVWFGDEEVYRRAADGENVRFELRFIPDSEIATYFAACDVVLAPYRIEAQSGVALTAFHFSRPVIASAVGGLPEIIDGNNGMLVPPDDPDALARTIDDFFTMADRELMERAAASSAGRYSWEEYGEVFRRMLNVEC